MNGTLFFDLAHAIRVAEETVAAAEHVESFCGVGGPCLIWAKDAGTYLMSNAVPRPKEDVIYARADSPTGMLLQEETPGDADVWDETRRICGGDDFAEFLELEDMLSAMKRAAAAGYTQLIFEVNGDNISIEMGR